MPKEWGPKMIRKIQASNEVLHKILGSIDTPEKFNAKRAELAQHEWDRMKRTDSHECRNCHNFNYMDYAEQNRRASTRHQVAFTAGQTCIDCHKGHRPHPAAHRPAHRGREGGAGRAALHGAGLRASH